MASKIVLSKVCLLNEAKKTKTSPNIRHFKGINFHVSKKTKQEKCSFKEKKTPSFVVVDDDYSRNKSLLLKIAPFL